VGLIATTVSTERSVSPSATATQTVIDPPLPAPDSVVDRARGRLLSEHPTYKPERLAPDGPNYITTNVSGDKEVALRYLTKDGAFLHFVCTVGTATTCRRRGAAMAQTPATVTPPTRVAPPSNVGPRGGRYHYSRSGKKVYERRR
jgi:hypothetical protein